MQFTKAMEYGMIIMTHLARRREERISAREITKIEGLPHAFTQRILQELLKADLVSSSRGVAGGYRLAKDPKTISLYDIHVALEGGIDFVSFFDERAEDPNYSEVEEPLRQKVHQLHDGIVQEFKKIYLSDFLA